MQVLFGSDPPAVMPGLVRLWRLDAALCGAGAGIFRSACDRHGIRRGNNDVEYRHGVRPLAGGWIFDTFISYSWLYLGSLSVALGAVAIVLAFPRLARAWLQLA